MVDLDMDQFISDAELAKMLRVSTRTTQKWRVSGKGPNFTRVGSRRVMYARSDVDAWVRANTYSSLREEAEDLL